MHLKELTIENLNEIRELFRSVFTAPPWNDDWSDEEQLDNYLKDLMCVRTPLILALFKEEEMIGIAIGNIRHWHSGTEYFIEELCIRTDMQKQGHGRKFLQLIEDYLKEHGLHQIFLMTERHVPAYQFYKDLGFEELPEHVSFFREF